MSSGITAGVAYAVHTGFIGEVRQTAVDSSAMPYVMVHLGYLGAPEPLRMYCASAWAFGGHGGDATKAAVAAAREWSKPIVESLKSSLKSGTTPQDLRTHLRSAAWIALPDEKERARRQKLLDEAITVLAEDVDGEEAKKRAVEKIGEIRWNHTLAGSGCLWRAIGLWVGKPLEFTTATKIGNDSRANRAFKPIFAAGLGWTPHSYFSILAGITASNLEDETGAVGRERTVWSLTFGAGGTLDLVGSLFK